VAKKIDVSKVAPRVANSQTDPILDNLPPAKQEGENWVLPRQRTTLQQAVEFFMHKFPGGFGDPGYLKEERGYKWLAHERYEIELGNGLAGRLLAEGQIEELSRKALSVVAKVNLLSLYENAAMRDAMKDREAAERFFSALIDLLNAPTIDATVFSPYIKTVCDLPAEVGRARVASWPVATILPFLAQPHRFMFLKPQVTTEAAVRLGFHLHYDPQPNWITYDYLLRMGKTYADLLTRLRPKDLIDIQSFIWVTCSG
jgi:hypothetical protein